jgi:rod shape-determining protein MreC
MLLDHRFQYFDPLRQGLGLAVYPLHWSADAPFQVAQWFHSHFTHRDDLAAEIAGLRAQQLLLQSKLQQLSSLEAENQRLRELLESTAHLHHQTLVARIMSVDLDTHQRRLLLDMGGLRSVYAGQPVLDAHGIIGQIIEVSPLSSVVVLLTDPSLAIPVQVARNGLRTVAVGAGHDLHLPYLARNPDLVVGDVLLSSGLGGIYPAGYPVALVTQIAQSSQAATRGSVIAQPIAQMERNREVVLLWLLAGAATP